MILKQNTINAILSLPVKRRERKTDFPGTRNSQRSISQRDDALPDRSPQKKWENQERGGRGLFLVTGV